MPESKVLPAGDYFIGDPCYAFDSEWGALLVNAKYIEDTIMEASHGGHSFVAALTAYGDGVYFDEESRSYMVDAGMIGVVPADGPRPTPVGMHRVTFPGPFRVSYDGGVITIGHIAIDTVCEGDEDDVYF